jgi:uncharacterized protein
MRLQRRTSLLFRLLAVALCTATPLFGQDEARVRADYDKLEQMITMRDGIKLFTSIYMPKDKSQKYPIMLNRTPYSVSPYGADKFRETLGPSQLF